MGTGVGKKLGSLLERMETMESTVPAIANAVQQVINQVTERQNNLDRVVMALVELTGKDAVAAKVEEMMLREATDASDKAKLNLEAALTKGQVTPSILVAEDSLVVGVESDKDGNTVVPGRIQLGFENFKPELQTVLLGRSVGAVVDTASGGKFTVQEIYQILPETDEAVVQ